MAPRVKTHRALLHVLRTAKPRLRKAILEESDRELVYSICEIAENLLLGNIKLTQEQKRKLKVYRNVLRQLAQRGEGWQKKKQLLIQKGGSFLPALLSALVAVLGNLF